MIVTPFETYKKFLAIRLHFESDSYDYFKYKGSVSATQDSFERRKDKFYFYKLSKKEDVEKYLVSNLFSNTRLWIGSLFDEEMAERFRNFQSRLQSITYNFKNDLAKFSSFEEALDIINGNYPLLFTQYKQGKVNPETLIILNDIMKIFEYWDKEITDTFSWPVEKKKLLKLRPFIQYDTNSMKKIISEAYK
jgi:hypothetical protein